MRPPAPAFPTMPALASRPPARRPAPDAERLTWLALQEAAGRWRGAERPPASTGASVGDCQAPGPVPSDAGARPRLQAASLRLDAAAWR